MQSLVVEIARKRQKKAFEWSCSTGLVPAGTSIQAQKVRNAATKDPITALDQVIDQVEPAIFIFKDFHPFLTKTNFAVIRKLKEIALHLKNSFKTVILISPLMEVPTGAGEGNHRPELSPARTGRPGRAAGQDHRGPQGVQAGEHRPRPGRARAPVAGGPGADAGGGRECLRQDHRQGRPARRRAYQRSLCRKAADHPQERAARVPAPPARVSPRWAAWPW